VEKIYNPKTNGREIPRDDGNDGIRRRAEIVGLRGVTARGCLPFRFYRFVFTRAVIIIIFTSVWTRAGGTTFSDTGENIEYVFILKFVFVYTCVIQQLPTR